jgi:hypothetical protein
MWEADEWDAAAEEYTPVRLQDLEADAEVIEITQLAKAWNQTSPPWSWGNQCEEQARALRFVLISTPWKYWTLDVAGGYNGYKLEGSDFGLPGLDALWGIQHNFVVAYPSRGAGNYLPGQVIDAYKHIDAPNSTQVQLVPLWEMKEHYPFPTYQSPAYPSIDKSRNLADQTIGGCEP